MNKQFRDSVRQKEKGADFKPMETGFPDRSNEIKQYCKDALGRPEMYVDNQVSFSVMKN